MNVCEVEENIQLPAKHVCVCAWERHTAGWHVTPVAGHSNAIYTWLCLYHTFLCCISRCVVSMGIPVPFRQINRAYNSQSRSSAIWLISLINPLFYHSRNTNYEFHYVSSPTSWHFLSFKSTKCLHHLLLKYA
jgi:hypothetical protein